MFNDSQSTCCTTSLCLLRCHLLIDNSQQFTIMSHRQISLPLLPLLSSALPSSDELAILSRSAPVVIPAESLTKLQPQLPRQLPYLVHFPGEKADEASVIDALNNGAEAAIIADTALVRSGTLPTERLVLTVTSESALNSLGDILSTVPRLAGCAITLQSGADPTPLQLEAVSKLLDTKTSGKVLMVLAASSTLENVQALATKYGASLVVPYEQISFASHTVVDAVSAVAAGKLDFARALFSPLHTDRADGLFPTVVTTTSGQSLGLVYSSADSLLASLLTGDGTYHSRARGLWQKGLSSGATQRVESIRFDCDWDAIEFRVVQRRGKQGEAFCHLPVRESCFGPLTGLDKLQATLDARRADAPAGSYTARLFNDDQLLAAKIREEAQELIDAKDSDKEHVAFEMADLLYFAFVRCARAGVSLADVEQALEGKAKKVLRRKGDAKPAYVNGSSAPSATPAAAPAAVSASASDRIQMTSYRLENLSAKEKLSLIKRPSIKSGAIQEIARPILAAVRDRGDAALLELTAKYDKCTSLTSPVRFPPFADESVMRKIKPEVKTAIDVAYGNIYRFHKAQKQTAGNVRATETSGAPAVVGAFEDAEDAVLEMETQPGVVCRRFARPIQRVGLYVPGGTAILPSTALMLGVPAKVARCPTIVLATPPRPDGSIAPEVLYVASLVGATCVLAAGGAQAVAAMAYGTETVPKVDKIVGPGNQFVTAAKMIVQNETDTLVSIDMPAGPSEVLVIADAHADPAFVASDLLSQAEHGPDSQVVLVAIDLTDAQVQAIEDELDAQAKRLPRVDTVRKAIEKSVTIVVPDRKAAMEWSNAYAPEHLILQVQDPEEMVKHVENAGSVFVGMWSPERYVA